jgi:hypothetical protein
LHCTALLLPLPELGGLCFSVAAFFLEKASSENPHFEKKYYQEKIFFKKKKSEILPIYSISFKNCHGAFACSEI